MSLHLDLKTGDELLIGDTVIKLEYKSGRNARLSIDADRETQVKLNKSKDLTLNRSGTYSGKEYPIK